MTTLFGSKQETSGFAGRPLVALLIAVGAGWLSVPVAEWMHIDSIDATPYMLVLIAAVGYYWSLAENKRYKNQSEHLLNERQ